MRNLFSGNERRGKLFSGVILVLISALAALELALANRKYGLFTAALANLMQSIHSPNAQSSLSPISLP